MSMDWVVFLYSLLRSCPELTHFFYTCSAIFHVSQCFCTFYTIHLQYVVEGLKPVAALTKTMDQGIKENLKKKVDQSPSFFFFFLLTLVD